MANKQNKKPVSFDEIIQSDRQKKQNEQLANQILGKGRKGRRASAPGAGVQKSQAPKPDSLASRIGMPKRSASTANLRPNKPNPNPLFTATPIAPKKNQKNTRRPNPERLQNAIETGSSQVTVHAPRAPRRSGLSIKGASGPFIVIGSNFAPGTTAADIESALEPSCGPMLGCRVISHNPTVTAEFAFENKYSAENLVANFHNQRADGRLLSMTLQPAGSPLSTAHNAYNDLRAQADRDRQNRRADPDVQDGKYGFGVDGNILRGNKKSSSGLYSDEMMVDGPVSRKSLNRRRQY